MNSGKRTRTSRASFLSSSLSSFTRARAFTCPHVASAAAATFVAPKIPSSLSLERRQRERGTEEKENLFAASCERCLKQRLAAAARKHPKQRNRPGRFLRRRKRERKSEERDLSNNTGTVPCRWFFKFTDGVRSLYSHK